MEDESRAESPVLEKRAPTNQCSPMTIILSIIVAIVAIGGSYLWTMSDEEDILEDAGVVTEESSAFDDEF